MSAAVAALLGPRLVVPFALEPGGSPIVLSLVPKRMEPRLLALVSVVSG